MNSSHRHGARGRALYRFMIGAVVSLHASSSANAQYDSFFIPAGSRIDVVHDPVRQLLYITNGSRVERFDLASRTLLDPFQFEGLLLGIDISPSGNRLAVAGGNNSQVHLVDLSTSAQRTINLPTAFYEGRTYSPAFVDDQRLLLSSTFQGSGWVPLRELDWEAGMGTEIASVRQGTMLAASADQKYIAYAESNISSGEFGVYNTSAETFRESGTGWFAFEVGVSRNGAQMAVPSYFGTFIYDADFNPLGTIGIYADESPIGLAYSPVADLVFFAWYDRDNRHPAIDVYSTTTLSRVDTIDRRALFGWNGNGAFHEGRLRISRDGRLLFATTAGGVTVYDVSALAPVPEPQSIAMFMAAIAGGMAVVRWTPMTTRTSLGGAR